MNVKSDQDLLHCQVFIQAFDLRVMGITKEGKVLLQDKMYSESQMWNVTNDGFIQSCEYKDYVLDVDEESKDIIIWKKKHQKNDNQRWKIEPNGTIISFYKNLALDVDSKIGPNLLGWKLKGQVNQKWSIVLP